MLPGVTKLFLPFFPQLEPMSLRPTLPVFVSFDAVAAIRDEILMQTSGGPLYVIATAGWTQAIGESQAVLSRVEFNIKLKPVSEFSCILHRFKCNDPEAYREE